MDKTGKVSNQNHHHLPKLITQFKKSWFNVLPLTSHMTWGKIIHVFPASMSLFLKGNELPPPTRYGTEYQNKLKEIIHPSQVCFVQGRLSSQYKEHPMLNDEN